MVKYYCDCCNNEVKRKSLLTQVVLTEVEVEDLRELNRMNAEQYSMRVVKDVCFDCRVKVLDLVKK